MTSAVIAGVGGALPSNRVSNADLALRMDTTDEWIRTRTGIGARYWAEGVSTGDLAYAAGRQALDSAGLEEVDIVIVATTTPDYRCPATAPSVAARLGLGTVPAFDLAAVCSGFIYALATAKGYIAGGLARSALVIGAETYSTILNPDDRTTSVIFGDGAGACVLRAGTDGEIGRLCEVDLGSDGSGGSLIQIPGGGSYQAAHPESDSGPYFTMQGRDVFHSAVTRMSRSSQAALERTGWEPRDVDWIVGHQANQRILHALADQLGVDRSNLVSNLDRVGNTSAASIPLALIHGARELNMRGGDKLLLTAFGGGTTWGSISLTWPEIVVAAPVSVSAEGRNGDRDEPRIYS